MIIDLASGKYNGRVDPRDPYKKNKNHKINERAISLVFLNIHQFCHTLYTNNIVFLLLFSMPLISLFYKYKTQLCWFYVVLLLCILFCSYWFKAFSACVLFCHFLSIYKEDGGWTRIHLYILCTALRDCWHVCIGLPRLPPRLYQCSSWCKQ